MANYNLENVKVLIVDDNQFMRQLLRSVVKSFNCQQIFEAANGDEAIKVIKGGLIPDIIITDWTMPTIDGVKFTRLIRSGDSEASAFMPIIMVSDRTEMGDVLEARDAGVTEFLLKPMSAKALLDRIASVISNPRSFVKTRGFFGPDRRRRALKPTGPERREKDC